MISDGEFRIATYVIVRINAADRLHLIMHRTNGLMGYIGPLTRNTDPDVKWRLHFATGWHNQLAQQRWPNRLSSVNGFKCLIGRAPAYRSSRVLSPGRRSSSWREIG